LGTWKPLEKLVEPDTIVQTVPVDLGTLRGSYSYPYAINARGQVVGYSLTSADVWHGFLGSEKERKKA
jgi:uncharacterized membrane protein